MPRRSIPIVLLFVFLLSSVAPAWADVRAKLSPVRDYVGLQTSIAFVNGQLLVWSPRRTAGMSPGVSLNPTGDITGDGWPNIAERHAAPHYPLVVWSRATTTGEYDLVWSEWGMGWWMPVAWLYPQGDTLDGGHDLDPDVRFDPQDNAYLVWCRETGNRGEVMFSLLVSDGWTEAYRVSDEGLDTGNPVLIGFSGDGDAIVEYDTPSGRITQAIELAHHPTSITEDIDPLITVTTLP
jgi:hypothetical protein